MKKKVTGIISLTSVGLLVLVISLIFFNGEHFRAANVQLALFLFSTSIASVGIYLMQSYCPTTPKLRKSLIGLLGIVFAIFAGLSSFNIIDVTNAYNWVISLGILYILLVQLQLLNWGKESNILAKICAYVLIVSNVFLFIYFIGVWKFYGIALWIDIAVISSLISFLLGVLVSNKSLPQSTNKA